eukprot:Clim_evm13s241 gene=Clim_evmTU13s241
MAGLVRSIRHSLGSNVGRQSASALGVGSLLLNQRRNIGACCVEPYFELGEGDTAFSVRTNDVRYGYGVLQEVGFTVAQHLEATKETGRRVAVFTDKSVAKLEWFSQVTNSLKESGFDPVLYTDVRVEPTDKSFMAAAEWFAHGDFKAAVSVGGGSVMDTTKAAILYGNPASAPEDGDFLTYVNAPVGKGKLVPNLHGSKIPHVACPTTAGTGSECTGFAICKLTDHPTAPNSKTGIASPALCPDTAVIDPSVTHTLPPNVVAASGFDVLSHAIESYTARPFTRRPAASPKANRPLNQGANPYSDMACLEALRRCGTYLQRAITDRNDMEAREQLMWASTVVGTAMGNAGVHLPHGLSYPVSGSVQKFRPDSGWPGEDAIVPHGMGVILCAPSAVRAASKHCPDRHMHAAELLGCDTKTAKMDDAGEVLAEKLIDFIKLAKFPNGISECGFSQNDVDNLTTSCYAQKRVVDNAPWAVSYDDLEGMYKGAMAYW